MPRYTLLFTPEGHAEAEQIDCIAPDPWLALQKARASIGRRTVELRQDGESLGRFRKGFPGGNGLWEVSPRS